MLKKWILFVVIVWVFLILTGCSSGGGSLSIDYESKANEFKDLIFSGKFDEAKAVALPGYEEDVNACVEKFAELYAKYDFKDVAYTSAGIWQPTGADPEIDKRVIYTYLYTQKGSDSWKNGTLNIRVKLENNKWGVGGMNVARPTR
jgi:hypothetical protein